MAACWFPDSETMKIALPDNQGRLVDYSLTGSPIAEQPLGTDAARTIFAAAHVVADPLASSDPTGRAAIDWSATLAFRRYLANLGLGIAEAMDTAQRGMGLDWDGALELITRTRVELPDALVFSGCGTDHIRPRDAATVDDVVRAYMDQLEAIQAVGGRLIIMASRALACIATSPRDYLKTYGKVLDAADESVILHWLGPMFDPALAGYWGSDDFSQTMETVLTIIEQHESKIDGIKLSLLDKDKEILLRRRLPPSVKMYTGDDFNYPELIEGDSQGFSHALLGVFDPLASVVGTAVNQLGSGDVEGFHELLDPTVPLARLIFRAPTQHYKTGVVFLSWLNGHQDHFIMLGGAQSLRPLNYFVDCFRLADKAGLLRDPECAVSRMRNLLGLYGVA